VVNVIVSQRNVVRSKPPHLISLVVEAVEGNYGGRGGQCES